MENITLKNNKVYLSNDINKMLCFIVSAGEYKRFEEYKSYILSIDDFIRIIKCLTREYIDVNSSETNNNFLKYLHYRERYLVEREKALEPLKELEKGILNEKSAMFFEKFIEIYYLQLVYALKIEEFNSIQNNPALYLNNFKYIENPDVRKYFIQRFNRFFDNHDEDGILNLLREMDNYSKLDWIKKSPKLDMKDGSFSFIGHSVGNYYANFDKEYRRYISCSFFDNENIDVYINNFGFIMNPANIVAAANYDLFINNGKKNELNLSSVRPHLSIDLERNIKNSIIHPSLLHSKLASSEIVVRGFNPVGIFRFTCGIDELDQDDAAFKYFAENNSEYKVYKFDVLESVKGDELELFKLDFLRHVSKLATGSFELIGGLDRDEFFKELSKLKKRKSVSRAKVLKLYRKFLNED